MEAIDKVRKRGLTSFKALDDESGALVYVFGQNSYGELGIGDLEERHIPTKLSYFDNIEISQVAAGNEHTAVLTKSGQVYTFGFNGSGQLGHGNTKSYPLPRLIESLADTKICFLASANGWEHLSCVSDKGEMYMCGYNNYGQLGNGTQINETLPTVLPDFKERVVSYVSCSYYHSIIIVNQSEDAETNPKNPSKTSVYSVGRNDSGQLGLEHNNHEFFPKLMTTLSSKVIVKAACGLHHSIFLTNDGQVYSSGFNDNGQLGLGDKHHRNTPCLVESLENDKVVDIACGYYHTLSRLTNGEVYSFGRNDKGQWGIEEVGTSYLEPVKITDFEVPHWIASMFTNSTDHLKVSKLSLYSSIGTKENTRVQDIKITKIACGCYHSILLSDTGHVFTFGRGNHGQLGHGSKDNISIPRLVSFFKDKKATDVAGGFYHTIVLVNSRGPKVNSLSFDMKKLLSDATRSDISFQIGKKLFHSHRCIIMARWKELHKHINKKAEDSTEEFMEEIGTNARTHKTLEILDTVPEAFQILLEFIYTGIVQNVQEFNPKVILDVFCLALKYDIKKLIGECEEYLCK